MGANKTEPWPRCSNLPATHPDGQAELLAGGQEDADAPDLWLHPACQQCPAHGGQLHSGWGLLSRQVSGSLHPMYLLERREHQCRASLGTGSSSQHACDDMFKNKNTPIQSCIFQGQSMFPPASQHKPSSVSLLNSLKVPGECHKAMRSPWNNKPDSRFPDSFK